MVDYTKQFCKIGTNELSLDERNILSVAFKNIIGTRRAAWRVLSSIQKKENNKGNAENVTKVKTYKTTIEKEMTDICEDILELLTDILIPNAKEGEGKVYFFKMKADYNRYVAEFSSGDKKNQAAQKALTAYNDALNVAKETLSPTHPIKLGLSLNHSVFYYEIMQNPEKACAMGRTAFDEAIADLDNVEDEYYKDTTLIMQLIRDNLTLWQSELIDDDAAPK